MGKTMTAKEFLDNSTRCPNCGGVDVAWGEITVEGNNTTQEALCNKCDATFYTISRLVGYGLYKWGTAECETRTIDADEPEQGRPSGEWLDVFLGLLSIVEDEYESDPEPDDIPSWKRLIDRAHRLLRSKQEQAETKEKDNGEAEQKRSGT